VSKVRTLLACAQCGRQAARWTGRCPACGSWGTIAERGPVGIAAAAPLQSLAPELDRDEGRIATGFDGVDRVLGGGFVPGSVTLLAGEPGIGKSTLLLQIVASASAAGLACILASGEESRAQVARRARRLGIDGRNVSFIPGRDLATVLEAAHAARPGILVVDSIQTLRDSAGGQMPGGSSQVRSCADSLIGVAKSDDVAIVLAGHVTKDGDLAGPRALEHAVDVVLTFEGDAGSGLRQLSGGKNRFAREGEAAWFEMTPEGLAEIDPAASLCPGEREAGSAVALELVGRRALAVEVQALVCPGDGPPRRHATGLDARRLALVAAVVDRATAVGLGRSELFGASPGGVRVDDPACDLAVAAALTSAATGIPPPDGAAFVGEIGLTGLVRPAAAMPQRLAAGRAARCQTVFAAADAPRSGGSRVVPVRHVRDALSWALPAAGRGVAASLRGPA
jgi:DNA repair protein RadA/Sms